LVLGACASPASDDVTGPFTGPVHRFVIDAIAVPRDAAQTMTFGADLDGNGTVDNKLGHVSAVLASTNDLTTDTADMIAAGALASTIELQADDLVADDAAGVRYLGAEGAAATVAGGTIVDGMFRANRTATTRVPGQAELRLPIYTNADPLVLPLEGMELDLVPDGRGGYDGVVRGGIRQDAARAAAYAGLAQMFATEPERHLVFQRQVDLDRDGTMSRAELDDSVIALLVTADLQLFDGTRYAPRPMPTAKDSLSIAFGVHLAPCPEGRCTTAAPADHCRDRVRDADETDVDCGGSCQPCAAALACSAPADCQSRTCTANRCADATCSDGVRDGVESDVDCGGPCAGCALDRSCAVDTDCASGVCDGGVASTGRCVAP